jgi:hypothetical protein
MRLELEVVVPACNPSTREEDLKFQASLGYTVRPWFTK